jgi:hypothetical protein
METFAHLPPFCNNAISVPTVNNTFNFQKLKKNSNALSYEAPDLDKKMITGNLPKSFFGETGKSSETRKTEIKKKTPNVAVLTIKA